jgi:hypothetical protein
MSSHKKANFNILTRWVLVIMITMAVSVVVDGDTIGI